MANIGPFDTQPYPRRGDDVEAWLKRWRDEWPRHSLEWFAVDKLLDDYRLHADVGEPLSVRVEEGGYALPLTETDRAYDRQFGLRDE